MSLDNCRLDVRKKLSKLNDDEFKSLVDEVEDIIRKSEKTGKDVGKIIREFSQVYRQKIEMSKHQQMLSIQKYEEWSEVFNQAAFKNDPLRFMQAILRADHGKKYTSAGNISRRKNQMKNEAVAMVYQVLDRHPALKKRFHAGDEILDTQLYTVLHDGVTKNVPADVIEFAQAIKKVNNHMFNHKRIAGFGTRYLDSFIAPGKHNIERMLKLGKTPAEAKANWINLAKKTFNFQRMEIAPDNIDNYLNTFWEKRLSSRGKSVIKFNAFKEITTNLVSERLGKERSVHFVSGEAARLYDQKAGSGKFLYERMLDGIEKDAGNVAAAQLLGPNAKATFTRLLVDAQNKAAELGKPLSRKDISKMENFYKFVVEGDHQPEMNMVARFGDKLKKFTDMSKLGTALFTTATDFGYGAAIISGTTGENFLSTQGKVISEFFKTFVSLEQQKAIANKLRVFAEDVNSLVFDHRFGDYGEDVTNPGLIDKIHERYMRATGLPRQARSMRLAISKMFSTELADRASLEFDKLYSGLQDGMGKFGIGKAEWDLLRKSTDDFGDGTKGITPERIMELEDIEFSNHPTIVKLEADFKAKNKKMTKAAKASLEARRKAKIQKIKQELSSNYSGFLAELAEVGSPTPGAEQAFWKSNFVGDRNTVTGQLLRFTLQYKSFAMAQFKTMQAITNVDEKWKTLGATIASTTGWGYLALSMKDLAKGREPRDPFDPKTMVDSFTQSGAGLIYMDFLTAEYNKSYRSLAKDIAGPVISGLGNDVSVLFAKAVRGDVKAAEVLRKIERNTPSIFFTKAALNRNIYDALYRSLNIKQRKSKKYKNFYSIYD